MEPFYGRVLWLGQLVGAALLASIANRASLPDGGARQRATVKRVVRSVLIEVLGREPTATEMKWLLHTMLDEVPTDDGP